MAAELITIEGKVLDGAGNPPPKGTRVIAAQEGTEIKQVVGDDGRFILHLPSGLWRISASARGFNEPEPYRSVFISSARGIDFTLQEGYSLSGQVFRPEDGLLAARVAVTAASADKTITRQTLTNQNGKYSFAGLPPGRWEVSVDLGEREVQHKTVTLGPDQYNANLVLPPRMEEADWRAGIVFFGSLCLLLAVLAGLYLWVHRRFPAGPEPEYAALTAQVDLAIQAAGGLAGQDDLQDQDLQALRGAVGGLKANWDDVSASILSMTSGQKAQVNLLLAGAETGVMARNPQEVEDTLTTLKAVFENPRSTYFWSQTPANYLEVLFWSLAGILVSLLVTNGYYLRLKSFYPEGIWMHVSHLITVPLLALVVVFLLSQVKLTVQIDQSEVALDIRDPRLLAALSFIIAVNPWRILNFIKEAARSFFSQARRRIGGRSEQTTQPGAA